MQVLVANEPHDMTVRDVARTLQRYSERWIQDILKRKREQIFHYSATGRVRRWRVCWPKNPSIGTRTELDTLLSELSGDALLSGVREKLQSTRLAGRVNRPKTRTKQTQEIIQKARVALASGRLRQVAQMLRTHGLDQSFLHLITPAQRQRLAVEVAHVRAELEMNQGRADEAIRICEQKLPQALEHEKELAVRLLAVRGAALRMRGKLDDSTLSFKRALDVLPQVYGDSRRELVRWVAASLSTPLTLCGDYEDSHRALSLSRDHVEDEIITNVAETELLHARLFLARHQIDQAEACLARVRPTSSMCLRWVRGWLHRYEFDVVWAKTSSTPSEQQCIVLAQHLEAAWQENEGYGFQRKIIAARAALLDAQIPLATLTTQEVARSLRGAVSMWHRQKYNLNLDACQTCSGKQLDVQIRHTLDIVPFTPVR